MKDFFTYIYLDKRYNDINIFNSIEYIGRPIYVGKGSKERAYSHLKNKSSSIYEYIIEFNVTKDDIVLIKHDTDFDSAKCELDLIYKFKRCHEGGTLLNKQIPIIPQYKRPKLNIKQITDISSIEFDKIEKEMHSLFVRHGLYSDNLPEIINQLKAMSKYFNQTPSEYLMVDVRSMMHTISKTKMSHDLMRAKIKELINKRFKNISDRTKNDLYSMIRGDYILAHADWESRVRRMRDYICGMNNNLPVSESIYNEALELYDTSPEIILDNVFKSLTAKDNTCIGRTNVVDIIPKPLPKPKAPPKPKPLPKPKVESTPKPIPTTTPKPVEKFKLDLCGFTISKGLIVHGIEDWDKAIAESPHINEDNVEKYILIAKNKLRQQIGGWTTERIMDALI